MGMRTFVGMCYVCFCLFGGGGSGGRGLFPCRNFNKRTRKSRRQSRERGVGEDNFPFRTLTKKNKEKLSPCSHIHRSPASAGD